MSSLGTMTWAAVSMTAVSTLMMREKPADPGRIPLIRQIGKGEFLLRQDSVEVPSLDDPKAGFYQAGQPNPRGLLQVGGEARGASVQGIKIHHRYVAGRF